jgi:tetratricopeptide (TPR) repeat protein
LKFQSEVADAITRAIASRLGVVRPAAGDSVTYSKNEQANVDYFRGRAHLAKDDQENLKKAEDHFLEAIRLDKSFANAHSGLADVYILMGADGFRSMDDAYRRARESATTALRIDPTLPDAHTSLAAVAGDYDWNWDDAERHLLRALQADPNHEPAARLYSFYLACLDRRDEALRFARQAVKLNPASPGALMNLAVIQYLARDYDQAIKTITETLDLEPTFGQAYVLMGRIYTAQGLHERAVEKLQHAHRLLGDRPDVITPLAYGLARANRRREALDAAQELRRIAKPGTPSPFRMAMIDIGLGNTNQAITGLRQALAAHDWQVTLLKVEPAFDSLRSDKQFGDLLERVGLSPR